MPAGKKWVTLFTNFSLGVELKTLDFCLKGHRFKPQHNQATLDQGHQTSIALMYNEIKVTLDKSIRQTP